MASQKENQRMTNPAERQRRNGPVNKKTVFATFSLAHQQAAPFIFKNTHFYLGRFWSDGDVEL